MITNAATANKSLRPRRISSEYDSHQLAFSSLVTDSDDLKNLLRLIFLSGASISFQLLTLQKLAMENRKTAAGRSSTFSVEIIRYLAGASRFGRWRGNILGMDLHWTRSAREC